VPAYTFERMHAAEASVRRRSGCRAGVQAEYDHPSRRRGHRRPDLTQAVGVADVDARTHAFWPAPRRTGTPEGMLCRFLNLHTTY
jgi:hypothetical protein